MRFFLRLPKRLLLAVMLAVPTACPSEVDDAAIRAAKAPAQPPLPDENDPRVVKDGERLYPAATHEKMVEAEGEPAPGRGSGRSDETNGVCRLFAPKLTSPQCCKADYGFDVATVSKACDLPTYFGESFQQSCGYYFEVLGETVQRLYFRLAFVIGRDAEAAAREHATTVQRLSPGITAAAVPGVAGAWWTTYDGVVWAFLPGWDKVRQLTWRETTCSKDAMIEVMRQLVTTPQPPADAPRKGLVPAARG